MPTHARASISVFRNIANGPAPPGAYATAETRETPARPPRAGAAHKRKHEAEACLLAAAPASAGEFGIVCLR
jgi:hypothetical protein